MPHTYMFKCNRIMFSVLCFVGDCEVKSSWPLARPQRIFDFLGFIPIFCVRACLTNRFEYQKDWSILRHYVSWLCPCGIRNSQSIGLSTNQRLTKVRNGMLLGQFPKKWFSPFDLGRKMTSRNYIEFVVGLSAFTFWIIIIFDLFGISIRNHLNEATFKAFIQKISALQSQPSNNLSLRNSTNCRKTRKCYFAP